MTLLRSLIIASWVVFAGIAYWAWRHTIDRVEHDAFGRDLRSLEALDARLNQRVIESQSSRSISYDPLTGVIADLQSLHRSLASPPGFLRETARKDVLGAVAASQRALFEKAEYVEDLKTENAVLRNSIRFLPIAAAELEGRLHTENLLGAVLLFNLVSDHDLVEGIVRQIGQVEKESKRRTALEDTAKLELLIAHVRVILERKPRVDELTTKILSVPTAALAESLSSTYARHYRAADLSAANLRSMLFVLALIILALAAFDIIVRLRGAAAALRRATEQLQFANSALREEKDKEQRRAEENGRFFLMTSHEVRKPLTVAMSSFEMLEAYGAAWPEERRKDHFSRIRTALNQMTGMFNDILLLGRAGAGILEHRPEPTDLAGFCARLVEEAQLGAGPKQRVVHALRGATAVVSIDEALLTSVIANLLSNALKYSPEEGEVRLEVSVEPAQLIFEVTDQGIGIPAKDLVRLFGLFQRASNVGKISGSGLGLAIVKAALEAQKGTISIDSREGEGSRFVVRVPCQVIRWSRQPSCPARGGGGRTRDEENLGGRG